MKRYVWGVLFLAVGFLAAGCKSTMGTGTAVFSGWVVDQGGAGIGNARVAVNGKATKSRPDGAFELSVPGAKSYVLNISHPGFAGLSQLSRKALTKQRWRLIRAQVETVDPAGEITLKDRRPEVARIGSTRLTIPPNSLVDPQGNPPAGPVRAAIATLDVGNGEGPRDWAVRSDDGTREGFLVSYGAVFVQFTDATGSVTYQLKSGAVGQISLPVIPGMRPHAPANPQARFWYYDESDGYWKHNGDATFDAASNAYVGTVNHLSFINTDIAKFDAACLKVTLSGIPVGHKLRIRYHSGGTPFGQTPILPLDDADNAAYRLPANTNVLLELMDGVTDEILSDMIVEDPVGNPLVNTVVNTGTAIPEGDDLWPDEPYTPCHAIVIKQGLPEVEIRINELPADAFPRDNPTDDYITWAPTVSRARLVTPGADVDIVLTNDTPGIPLGGDVLFAAHAEPWPANTTATANTLALTLPGSGAWVPFVIAGKHGTPSTNDKDTIIEAHVGNAAGPIAGTKALMVRVRKNANNLTPGERARFLFAWRKFRNQGGTNYVQFQELHRLASLAGDEGHMQPAFLTWHRAMLLHVERELQKLEPTVALHYWDWDAAAPNVFSEDLIGAPGVGGFLAEPDFSPANPMNGWNTDLPFSSGELRRSTIDHTADPDGYMKPLDDMVAEWNDYGFSSSDFFFTDSFCDDVERSSHNNAHGWPCGGGNLTYPNRSATDPLFYLLHSQIDREYAFWQRAKDAFGLPVGDTLTFPFPHHYDNNGTAAAPGLFIPDADHRQKGAFLDDGLWPWDGTTGGTPFTVAERPPNTTPDPADENSPDSAPVVPGTAFPASVIRNLWPAVPTIPHNAHMIDYLGRFKPADGLGFCYDDVPYQE
ncbi:MAG TPA: tyrosinase family protein [Thermoanaerobaculia bacterium]|nr:tyrosinase family protein [Thermoanaerobaculia bacterium]